MPFFIYFFFGLLLFYKPLQAAEYACPETITGISKNTFSIQASEIIQRVYRDLGCQVNIIMMPGKRGSSAFINGDTDGEVLRLPLIEQKYAEGQFIRSDVPLMEIENILVKTKGETIRENSAYIGYQLGIIWQMEYVKNKLSVSYNSIQEILDAFQHGKIKYFVTTKTSLLSMIDQKKIDENLIEAILISKKPLYHYLKPKYAPFMKAFSDYLEENQPFNNFRLKP